MKVSKRDLKLLLILGGLLLFILLYFTVFTRYQEKTAQIEGTISQLQPQLTELEAHYLKLNDYEKGIAQASAYLKEQMLLYPTNIEDEDFLVWLLDWRDRNGLGLDSVTLDAPVLLSQFPCYVDQDGQRVLTDLSAYRSTALVSTSMSYPTLKSSISTLYESPLRTVLDSVSVTYDGETGGLTGVYGISKFYLTRADAPLAPSAMPITGMGATDLFGTT